MASPPSAVHLLLGGKKHQMGLDEVLLQKVQNFSSFWVRQVEEAP